MQPECDAWGIEFVRFPFWFAQLLHHLPQASHVGDKRVLGRSTTDVGRARSVDHMDLTFASR